MPLFCSFTWQSCEWVWSLLAGGAGLPGMPDGSLQPALAPCMQGATVFRHLYFPLCGKVIMASIPCGCYHFAWPWIEAEIFHKILFFQGNCWGMGLWWGFESVFEARLEQVQQPFRICKMLNVRHQLLPNAAVMQSSLIGPQVGWVWNPWIVPMQDRGKQIWQIQAGALSFTNTEEKHLRTEWALNGKWSGHRRTDWRMDAGWEGPRKNADVRSLGLYI